MNSTGCQFLALGSQLCYACLLPMESFPQRSGGNLSIGIIFSVTGDTGRENSGSSRAVMERDQIQNGGSDMKKRGSSLESVGRKEQKL